MNPETPDNQGSVTSSGDAGDMTTALPAETSSAAAPIPVEPTPPPIDARSVLKIGLASPVFGWIFLVGLSNLLAGSTATIRLSGQ